MASRSATAAKLGAANATIDENMHRIADALDLEVAPPVQKVKDLAHGAAVNAERMASFLANVANAVDPDGKSAKNVADKVAVQNQVTPEPPSVEERLRQQAEDAQTVDDDPDPKIGGHKLSFYEGKSDEQILKLKGVGQATLDQIREAQAKRGQ
jgi:hypothetical protein